MAEYYAQRAGTGLVITEATTVSAQGNGWVGSPGIYTDEMGDSWRQVVDAVTRRQMAVHRSSCSSGTAAVRRTARSTAVSRRLRQRHQAQRRLRPHPRWQEGLRDAARARDRRAAGRGRRLRGCGAARQGRGLRRCRGALGQWLPAGPVFCSRRATTAPTPTAAASENRFRLLREVVEGITEVFPANRIGVRLAPNGAFNDMGSEDYRETFLYAAKELDTFGLAYLHVMDGLAFGFHELGEPMTLADFREVFSGPLIGNCGYDGDTANAAIESGAADLIAIGRPMLANPDYIARLRNGWPLAPLADTSTWYSGGEGGAGYTDFPAYEGVGSS